MIIMIQGYYTSYTLMICFIKYYSKALEQIYMTLMLTALHLLMMLSLLHLSPIALQNMLDICFRYSGKWTFKFSVLKCFIRIVGQLDRYIEFKLGNEVPVIKLQYLFTQEYHSIQRGVQKMKLQKVKLEVHIKRCGCY